MPKVYVTNDTGQDYSAATEFGELVRLTEGPFNIFRPERGRAALVFGLQNFEASEDFLMPSGSALSVGFAMAHLQRVGVHRIRLLLYEAKKRQYFVREVDT